MARTTCETLCTNGFLIQRKNVKIFFTLPRNNYQNGSGRTARSELLWRVGPAHSGRDAPSLSSKMAVLNHRLEHLCYFLFYRQPILCPCFHNCANPKAMFGRLAMVLANEIDLFAKSYQTFSLVARTVACVTFTAE